MIDDLREKIDQIDDQVIPLLEERLKLAKEIKKFKKKGKIFDPKRESQILSKIKSHYIQDIYKTIFKNSKEVQQDDL